jgi:hypothetical protein
MAASSAPFATDSNWQFVDGVQSGETSIASDIEHVQSLLTMLRSSLLLQSSDNPVSSVLPSLASQASSAAFPRRRAAAPTVEEWGGSLQAVLKPAQRRQRSNPQPAPGASVRTRSSSDSSSAPAVSNFDGPLEAVMPPRRQASRGERGVAASSERVTAPSATNFELERARAPQIIGFAKF